MIAPRSLPPRPTSPGTLADARAVLQARFAYPDFRPPQRRAVEAVLSGRDALIVLPTGGGKSLCYQVPALVRGGLAVVVSPLISLMKDQVEALERRGIAAAFINSTLAASAVSERLARLRDGSLALLYLSPERMEAGRMTEVLRAVGVRLLAVDEAHCISEWGHDFRPSYRRIGTLRAQLGHPQTVALTATATPDVRADIIAQLALDDPAVVVGGFDRPNLSYHVRAMRGEGEKDAAAIALLREVRAPAVVYTPTRRAVERLTAVLARARLRALAYHAGLDHAVRQRAQEAFMADPAHVIVATSAFGMGIDKPDVRLVIHHAMSGTLEAYYQEAGRAGRDGHASRCVLLHDPADRATHEYFLAGTHATRREIEHTWRALCRLADAGGWVAGSLDEVARRVPGLADRTAAAALRALAAAQLVTAVPPVTGRVQLRLLATPARIVRELRGEREFERDVLRVLWRGTRGRITDGVTVDLEAMPPGLGGTSGLVPVLERLAAQQFVVYSRCGHGLRVTESARHHPSPPLDWAPLERRRSADLARLDAMEGYAQTRYCRRAYLLRYFGDPDARSPCDACDRCLAPPESAASLHTRRGFRSRARPRS